MTTAKIDYTVKVDCPNCTAKIDLTSLGTDDEMVICAECGKEHGTAKTLREKINAAVLKDGKAKILAGIKRRKR
jgi:DNA-directed RNA polymerase subunit RPC12/RpoP